MQRFFTGRLLGRKTIFGLTVLTGMLIFFASVVPHETVEKSFYPQISDLFDASVHFCGFFLFNFLLAGYVSAVFRGRLTGKAVFLYFLVGIGWGILCEGSQLLAATRGFQIMDVAANTLPSLAVFYSFRRIFRSPHF